MKNSEVLREILKLIEKPENWTQGTYARDIREAACAAFDSNAYSYCMLGALCRTSTEVRDIGIAAVSNEIFGLDNHGIAEYNDSAQHEDVIEFIKFRIQHFENLGQ